MIRRCSNEPQTLKEIYEYIIDEIKEVPTPPTPRSANCSWPMGAAIAANQGGGGGGGHQPPSGRYRRDQDRSRLCRGLQGFLVNTTTPTVGQVLTYGSPGQWEPDNPAGGSQGPQGFQGTQGNQGFPRNYRSRHPGRARDPGQLRVRKAFQGNQGVRRAIKGFQGTQGFQGPSRMGRRVPREMMELKEALKETTGHRAQGNRCFQGPQGTQGNQELPRSPGIPGPSGIPGSHRLGEPGRSRKPGRARGGWRSARSPGFPRRARDYGDKTVTQGVQGAQGGPGATGATGAQGSQGNQGTQGHQGFQGTTGTQGVQGTGLPGQPREPGISRDTRRRGCRRTPRAVPTRPCSQISGQVHRDVLGRFGQRSP